MLATSTLGLAGIITPVLTVLFGGAAAYAAFYPQIRERRNHERQIRESARRLERAADIIFGFEGDPRRGLLPIKSLTKRVEENEVSLAAIKKTIGLNGRAPSKSVLQMLDDAAGERAAMHRDLEEVKRAVRRSRDD